MQTIVLFVLLGRLEISADLGPPETCRATVFGYRSDSLKGGTPPALGRPLRPDDWLVAHRWRKRRTMVQICRGDRCVIAPVLDRGPFGRIAKDGTWYNAVSAWEAAGGRGNPQRAEHRIRDGGRWNGCLDLSPPVAVAIDLKGSGNRRAGRVTVRAYRLRLRWLSAAPRPCGRSLNGAGCLLVVDHQPGLKR